MLNAILIYVSSNLTHVSEVEGILFNFNDFCLMSLLRFLAVLVCFFPVLKLDSF